MEKTGLICESVAVDHSMPGLRTQFGEYTMLDSPETMMVPQEFQDTIKELGDEKPMFITVAVPIGDSRYLTSESNPDADIPNRHWPEHVMDTLASAIREGALPGYRGHQEDLNKLPDSAAEWVAAGKAEKITGEKAILARGYIYPQNNNRYFIKTGSFNSVSPMAMSRVKPEVRDDGAEVNVVEQANWLSLDFVRKNTQGLRGATVVTKEGAVNGMKLNAEQQKLVTELGVKELTEYNPALVKELSTAAPSNDQTAKTIDKLTDRIQELTCEKADLSIEVSHLDGVASVLGCEKSEVSGKIGELKAMQAQSIGIAKETAIAALGNSPLKDVVAKRLKDVQFGSAKEAEEAVAAEVATAKEYIASMGGHLGGINSTQSFDDGGTGVTNAAGAAYAKEGVS